ncbi:MAG: hypothetical protein ACNA7E_02975, partial [Wenzhouxiangellaceae bacterium]
MLKWLQSLSAGTAVEYPEPGLLADDARALLERWDENRRKLRETELKYRQITQQIGRAFETGEVEDPEELCLLMNDKLKALERMARGSETEMSLEMVNLRDRLTEMEDKNKKAQEALAAQKSKMDPVLRYAYNLRRLIEAVHCAGRVSPEILQQIEDLLIAGGVVVDTRSKQ